jgi:hypothetical protein
VGVIMSLKLGRSSGLRQRADGQRVYSGLE